MSEHRPVETASGQDAEPSVSVVEAVADRSDRSIQDVPPLTRVVDPDALDALVGSLDDGSITFAYGGYVVTVTDGGRVSLTPIDGAHRA